MIDAAPSNPDLNEWCPKGVDPYRRHEPSCSQRQVMSFALSDEYPHRFGSHCRECGAFMPLVTSRREKPQ